MIIGPTALLRVLLAFLGPRRVLHFQNLYILRQFATPPPQFHPLFSEYVDIISPSYRAYTMGLTYNTLAIQLTYYYIQFLYA